MIILLALAVGALAQVPGRPLAFQPAPREAFVSGSYDDADAMRRRLAQEGDWYSIPAAVQPVLVIAEKGYLDAVALARFSKDVIEAVAGIPEYTGRRPPRYAGRIVLYVYDRGPASEADVPGVKAGERGVMLRFVKEDEAPVFHELTHLLAGYSTESPSLSEGLGEYVDAHFRPGKAHAFTPAGADPDLLAKRALARDSAAFAASIGAVNDRKPFATVAERHDFYFASWSFVKFLAARKSLGAVFDVMDAGGGDDAYNKSFGAGLGALKAAWIKTLAARPD